jgi:hypothetical protein
MVQLENRCHRILTLSDLDPLDRRQWRIFSPGYKEHRPVDRMFDCDAKRPGLTCQVSTTYSYSETRAPAFG